MASNLILRIASEFSPQGFNDLNKALNDTKRRVEETAVSADGISTAFRDISRIIGGTVLTLPLVGFVQEAIKGEEAIARMNLQFRAMGSTITEIDFERVASQVKDLAGISSTELATALTVGIRYFKDTQTELALLNTAIGMTKVAGISLATAFQQLGYIQQGNTLIARRYGVATHTEIAEPTARAAAVLNDMRKAMEPMAESTGTAAEELKKFGTNIGEIGKTLGEEFIGVVGGAAKVLNQMSPAMQEVIVKTIVMTGAVGGLTLAIAGLNAALLKTAGGIALAGVLKDMGALVTMKVSMAELPILWKLFATSIGGALIGLVAMTASLVNFFRVIKEQKGILEGMWKQQDDDMAKVNEAMKTNLDTLGKEVSVTQDLDAVLKELGATRELLGIKQQEQAKWGKSAALEETKAQIVETQKRIDNINKLENAKKDLGLKTADDIEKAYEQASKTEYEYDIYLINKKYAEVLRNESASLEEKKKFQAVYDKEVEAANQKRIAKESSYIRDLANLRVATLTDNIQREFDIRVSREQELGALVKNQNTQLMNAEIAQRRAAAKAEAATLTDEYRKSLEFRKAFAEKNAKEERDIRIKYMRATIDATLEYALMSAEEQKKYDEDRASAQEVLRRTSIDRIKDLSDAEKETLKTSAGQKALEEAITAEVTKRANEEQRMAEARKSYESRNSGLSSEVQTLKDAGVKTEAIAKIEAKTDINISITPSVGELTNAVVDKVRVEVDKKFNDIKTEFSRQLSAGRMPS